jgi:hypothetical protein
MAIAAHNPANPRKQSVQTPQLAIIEFVLEELPYNLGTAGGLLRLSLGPNYQAASHTIHHQIINFDISGENALVEHRRRVGTLAKELQQG